MTHLKRLQFYYSSFSGKAGRLEYSIYFLINIICCISALCFISKTSVDDQRILYLFYADLIMLLKLIPMQAVATRRLRDLNLNTTLIIITLIPILNFFFEIYLSFKKGSNIIESKFKKVQLGSS